MEVRPTIMTCRADVTRDRFAKQISVSVSPISVTHRNHLMQCNLQFAESAKLLRLQGRKGLAIFESGTVDLRGALSPDSCPAIHDCPTTAEPQLRSRPPHPPVEQLLLQSCDQQLPRLHVRELYVSEVTSRLISSSSLLDSSLIFPQYQTQDTESRLRLNPVSIYPSTTAICTFVSIQSRCQNSSTSQSTSQTSTLQSQNDIHTNSTTLRLHPAFHSRNARLGILGQFSDRPSQAFRPIISTWHSAPPQDEQLRDCAGRPSQHDRRADREHESRKPFVLSPVC